MTGLLGRLRRSLDRRRRRLLASGWFDAAFYVARNADVAAAGHDPATHYLRYGAGEGRAPGPLFEPWWYQQQLPRGSAGINLLEHYLAQGAAQGLSPHPFLDPAHYSRAAGIRHVQRERWLRHFFEEGEAKGISPHPLIDLDRLAAGYGAKHPFAGLLARFAADPNPPANPHPLFDVAYYAKRYPEVAAQGLNPLAHYLAHGGLACEPSPHFDGRYYLAQLTNPIPRGVTPLQHYCQVGGPLGCPPSRRFSPYAFARRHTGPQNRGVDLLQACLALHDGKIPVEFAVQEEDVGRDTASARFAGDVDPAGRRRVLLVAHVAGKALFGAERSFLDMVRGAHAAGYAVYVALPQLAPEYIQALQPYCADIAVLAYSWWRQGRPPEAAAVEAFGEHLARNRIELVHVNTIMLREPLIAARQAGIPSLVHVREIIEDDPDLLATIGEPAERIASQIASLADAVVANSEAAAKRYRDRNIRVLRNSIDLELFEGTPRPNDGLVRFGLVSSNIPKKGLADFVALARGCHGRVPKARFIAIGPDTVHAQELRSQLERDGMAAAVEFAGYIADSASAIASIDVVVNFSHFAESFGRTVLEGMAAQRPAIVYGHGALPELVEPGANGFVVPFREWQAAIPLVELLCGRPALLEQLGAEAARRSAAYGFAQYARAVGELYGALLRRAPATARPERKPTKLPPPEHVAPARALPAPRAAAELRVAYFLWHFPVPSETFVLNELRHLRHAGIDVRVFCRQSPHPEFRPDFEISWERVATPEQLAERLRQTGRNMVHAHFAYPTVTDMVWPACEAARVPFTFIPHAQDIFRHENDARNRIGEIARSPNCLRVLALGSFHRDFLVDRGVPDEKLLILHQGVDCSLFPFRSAAARERGRKVVAVQRFIPKKGLDNLIRAAVLLRDEGVSVELYGYGPDEPALCDLAAQIGASNVAFKGPLAGREALLAVFEGSDLVVAPGVRAPDGDMDGIPTILIEAMASGVPVLATLVASTGDLLVPEVTGFALSSTEPAAVAAAIREALAAPRERLQSMLLAARERVERRFDTRKQTPALVRLWSGQTIDIVIVSWNNLDELREVVARVYRFTRMPFHLIICDNASQPEVREYLGALHREKENVTVIDRGFNSFVGPGTNCAIEQGRSDHVIYLCGKEGFVLQQGWERAVVDFMEAHPDVGLAGTLCYSPTYLRGKDLPKGIRLFEQFRNREFAAAHPEREFRHVQGGLFALRRRMYDEIGGFSEEVPHDYTDAEYSFYVESCGWKLGEIPGLLSLYSKTRPPIASRFTEDVLAVHPPRLADLPALDALVAGRHALCNVCFAFLAEGFGPQDGCPKCGCSPSARRLMRALAESTLTYRRLKALVVAPPPGLDRFLAEQFQGRQLSYGQALAEADGAGLDARPGSLDVACLGAYDGPPERLGGFAAALGRVLAPGATVFADPSVAGALNGAAFRPVRELRYASRLVRYDTGPLHMLERVP